MYRIRTRLATKDLKRLCAGCGGRILATYFYVDVVAINNNFFDEKFVAYVVHTWCDRYNLRDMP